VFLPQKNSTSPFSLFDHQTYLPIIMIAKVTKGTTVLPRGGRDLANYEM
jgi:hypothetical protein